MDTKKIKEQLSQYLASEDSVEAKRSALQALAQKVLQENFSVRRAATEMEIMNEKVTQESKRQMDKYINISKEKENTAVYNKKMLIYLQDVKKKTELMLESQKTQKGEYQAKFEEIMKKLEQDYNYDKKKCELAQEENLRLRAKTEKISEDIKSIDNEYQTNLAELSRILIDFRTKL